MNKLLIADLNLHLEYKYTDRGGRQVFEIFNAEDNEHMLHPLGTIHIAPPETNPLGGTATFHWVAVNNNRQPVYALEQQELDV